MLVTFENAFMICSDEAMRGLELREWHDNEVDAYVELLNKHHYLKCPHARKRHLSQVACYQGKAVALLIWTTSSRKLIHRDEYIGWDSRSREKRLSWIVQNNRFLLLPQDRPINLASRILGLAIKVNLLRRVFNILTALAYTALIKNHERRSH